MKQRKSAMILALVLVLSLLLSACGGGGSSAPAAGGSAPAAEGSSAPAEGTTIKYVATGAGNWEPHLEKIVARYKELTGVTVEFECYAHDQLFQVLEVQMSAGSSDIDVLAVDVPMVAGYVEKGYLSPMDSYFTAEELAQFVPAAVEAGTWKDSFYAPPMNTSAQALYYNKTLLDQAGITIPEADPNNRLTWEELTKLAREALDKVDPDGTNGINGIVFEQVSRAYQMLALPNSLGEKSIGDDGLTVEGIIDTPGWVKAMTWYGDLFESGLSPRGVSPEENGPTFRGGKTIFYIGGSWVPTGEFTEDFEWDYTYHPCWEGYEDKIATPTGSWHFGVSAFSDQKDAAADFIKFISLGEGNDMWLELNGDVPARISKVDEVLSNSKFDEFPLSVQKIAAYEAANTAYPRPVTPAYSEYENILNTTMEDIRNGADPATALADCVEQTNSIMAKFKD